jgi:hypothetical protein
MNAGLFANPVFELQPFDALKRFKEQACRLLDNLPDTATWDDVMYRIYVRQAIEAGIKDSDQGRTLDVKDVRKRFGLPI